jgi:hypothetical protein
MGSWDPFQAIVLLLSLFIIFVVLGFELRVLYLLDRCSTAWAMPPARFAVYFFKHFY